MLPISHDEVVHGKGSLAGKMPGDHWQRLANVRALLAYMWAHPGKQLLFMGCELADEREWSEERGLDWYLLRRPGPRRRAAAGRATSTAVYRDTPALWAQDTDAGRVPLDRRRRRRPTTLFVVRARSARTAPTLVCVVNFAGVAARGLPDRPARAPARWQEVLNTDAQHYGGSGVGNLGAVHAEDVPWHGLPASAALRVPPLGALWLRRD